MTSNCSLILVVEDDRVAREMSSETIRAAGLRVISCETGEAALEILAEHRPDLVVLDLTMPGISGVEVLRVIRAREASEDVPVIVATGLSDLGTIDAAYLAGATDFVIKPIVYPILIERIRYMLRSSRAYRTLAEARRALEDAQRLMRSGSWEWNARESRLWISESLREMLPTGPHPSNPANLVELTRWIHPEDRSSASTRLRRCLESGEEVLIDHRVAGAGGEILFVRQQVARMVSDDGPISGLKGVVLDRTREERASLKADLWENYDSTTGLPNRHLLLENLDRAIETAIATEVRLAIVCLELDRAAELRSALDDTEHRALVCAMAERLMQAARDPELLSGARSSAKASVAHARESQFAVLLTSFSDEREAVEVAGRLRNGLAESISAEGLVGFVGSSLSAGLSSFPNDGSRPGDLLRAAERALHEAHVRGGNRLEIASPELALRVDSALTLERELATAFHDDALEVAYQPIVASKTGRPIGFECSLARSGGGTYGTGFLPLADRIGLIGPISRRLIETALADTAAWRSSGDEGRHLGFDASPAQLRIRGFAADLAASLRHRDVRPDRIELELDERLLGAPDRELRDALRALKGLGIRICLDHFGTGPGSLQRLLDFPVESIKMDRSLWSVVLHPEATGRRMIEGIVTLAHDLGMRVIANGVDTPEAFGALRETELDAFQGAIFSAPVSIGRASRLLEMDLLEHVDGPAPIRPPTGSRP